MKRTIAAILRVGKVWRLPLLFFVLCLLSSCLQIDYYITINRDGSETVTQKIAALKEFKLDKMENQLKTEGYAIIKELHNDSIFLTATQTFPEGKWIIPYPMDLLKDSVKLQQSCKNYFFVKRFMLNATYAIDKSKASDYLDNNPTTPSSDDSLGDSTLKSSSNTAGLFTIPLRYHIHVPGKIDTTTAMKVELNTMTWNYKIENGETVNIAFASTELNYTYLIVLGIVIVAIIYYFFSRKK